MNDKIFFLYYSSCFWWQCVKTAPSFLTNYMCLHLAYWILLNFLTSLITQINFFFVRLKSQHSIYRRYKQNQYTNFSLRIYNFMYTCKFVIYSKRLINQIHRPITQRLRKFVVLNKFFKNITLITFLNINSIVFSRVNINLQKKKKKSKAKKKQQKQV